MLTEPQLRLDTEPTLRDVSEALVAVFGTDYGIHSPTWISRFTDMTRQAAAYRDRRVLLAGDAAHVHPPVGGQGLNIGVQDAVNFGWKLAQVVKQTSPESLLVTYHAARHPVAARVLRNTMAQMALRRPDDRTKALGDTVSELFSLDEPRRHAGGSLRRRADRGRRLDVPGRVVELPVLHSDLHHLQPMRRLLRWSELGRVHLLRRRPQVLRLQHLRFSVRTASSL